MPDDRIERLRRHLEEQYRGIFDAALIQRHIDEYVDTRNAVEFAEFLVGRGHEGQRMLDIGSGYGANVIAARNAGIDARGLEIAPFEVAFARERLSVERPGDVPEEVYFQGSGLELPFESQTFDVVTLMNVIEHVPDSARLLSEAARLLKPGGVLYAVCPNYAAFRLEAHYQVPWLPLLPRAMASFYLRILGRNPRFFQRDIYYCTNWGVLSALSTLHLRTEISGMEKINHPAAIGHGGIRAGVLALHRMKLAWLARLLVALRFFNPFKPTINVAAKKVAAS